MPEIVNLKCWMLNVSGGINRAVHSSNFPLRKKAVSDIMLEYQLV